jgi:hypothetical protein
VRGIMPACEDLSRTGFVLAAGFGLLHHRNVSYPGYSFEDRFLRVRGTHMHYIDEGPRSAEPVVMVHGNPTWSAS